jgi:dynein heavy chain, axonemal
MNNNPFAL